MKFRLLGLGLVFACSVLSEQWALCSVTGGYLVERKGSFELVDEFDLRDTSFSWTFDKQPDGAVLICNAGTGEKSGPWIIEVIDEYNHRRFKDRFGKLLKVEGSDTWRLEPVPEEIDLKGRGAKLTWTEYQAEAGEYRGRVVGPTTDISEPAAEAVGRMAISLEEEGDFVAWTVMDEADGFSVRYSMPDAPAGGGIEASLSLYVNGGKVKSLPLTSKHVRVYGTAHKGARLWNDDPKNGESCVKYFDMARFVLDAPVQAGDRIELRKGKGDAASFYLIDMIELEKIPTAVEKPKDYLCITEFGAKADDGEDDSYALKEALAAAAHQKIPGVWIPAGIFDFESPVLVPSKRQDQYQRFVLNNAHLQGAGPWYTILKGLGVAFQCQGNHIRVSDLTLDGLAVERATPILFMGQVGQGSEFWNLYITRTGVAHSISDNNSVNLKVHDLRISEIFAGGINLRGGHDHAVIENVHVRGTGDDGLIFWSPDDGKSQPTRNSVIRNCTVEVPWLANGYLLAGGENCTLQNCVVRDGVRHCGVRATTQVYITPTAGFSGTTAIRDVSIIRCGSEKPGLYNGALQLEAHGFDVTGIQVEDCDIYSALYCGIQPYTKIDSKSNGGKKVEAEFKDVRIHGAALYGIHVPDRTPGQIALKEMTFEGVLLDAVKNDSKEMSVHVCHE